MKKKGKEDKWRREERTEEGKEGKLSQSLFLEYCSIFFLKVCYIHEVSGNKDISLLMEDGHWLIKKLRWPI